MVGEFLKLAGRLGLSFGAELYLFCDGLLYLLRVFVMDSINFMSPWTVNQLKRSYQECDYTLGEVMSYRLIFVIYLLRWERVWGKATED